MGARELLAALAHAGMSVEAADNNMLIIRPASKLTDPLRAALRAAKPEILLLLAEAHTTSTELIEAAMVACDYWHDGPEARNQMRRDLDQVPADHVADLLAHFRQAYRKTP